MKLERGRGSAGMNLFVLGLTSSILGLAPALRVVDSRIRLPGGSIMPESCWFHVWTGWHCPFCGMTRSVVSCVHGDLVESFSWHPGGPVLTAFLGLSWVLVVRALLARRASLVEHPNFTRALSAITLLCAVAGCARPLWHD